MSTIAKNKNTKIKLMNYVPAIFVPILLCMFM